MFHGTFDLRIKWEGVKIFSGFKSLKNGFEFSIMAQKARRSKYCRYIENNRGLDEEK